MFNPPEDLPLPALRAALIDGWSLHTETLEYRPVGFGGHHWTADGRWFVTASPPNPRLRASLSAALALEAAGGSYVVAPVPARDGSPLVPIGDAYAVTVYPLITGESFDWDNYTAAHRLAMLDLVVAVHAAPAAVRDLARADDYELTFPPVAPGPGPYGGQMAELLDTHATTVRAARSRYDELVAGVRAVPPPLVLTHGEPHPGNTMRAGGRWLLIDWETALAAPPERDVWHLDGLAELYTEKTGTTLRPEILELYRLRWDLTEIAEGVAWFGAPHGDTDDDKETWANLVESVENL
ncbi:phosphotransferase family protein [Actinoplanes sp. NPDC049265]|uniref:phosphotransferase family protein n=1 Tax=Actinoplanes sp. NPDC049265 TaxID=3363902 RepID=UPI0037170169